MFTRTVSGITYVITELASSLVPLVKKTQSNFIIWEDHQLSSSRIPLTSLFAVTDNSHGP